MTQVHGSLPRWSWGLLASISCGEDPQVSLTYFAGGDQDRCVEAFTSDPTLSSRCGRTAMDCADRSYSCGVGTPPKYAVSSFEGKMKANLSRQLRSRYPELSQIYWGALLWSPGFFSSTVGLNEAVIRGYVDLQERVDKRQIQLKFEF